MEPSASSRSLPRRALPWLALSLVYTLVTCVFFWPLPRLLRDHLGPNWGDPLFVLYVLKWGVHQIQLGLPDVWNANFFFPTRETLAYSDHLLGPAVLALGIEAVVPGPAAAYNVLLLTSFVGSALAVAWVLRQSGFSWLAAVLGGGMYAFSPYRMSQLSHLQMLLAQWMPMTLWYWDRLLARKRGRDAVLFLGFYLLNLLGGCYLAYMIHFCLLALFLSRLAAERRELFSRSLVRFLVPVVLVAAAVGAAIFLPYARVARAERHQRTPEEIRAYAATPASYLSPSFENLYFNDGSRQVLKSALGSSARFFFRSENSLFAGFLPTALFVVGAVAAWRGRRRGEADPWVRGIALSGAVCFALSFAPVFVTLARVLPGLSGMRVPTRIYVLLSFAVVFFAARGVDVLRMRLASPRARAALAAILALLLAVELLPRRLEWTRLPWPSELPKAYTFLRDDPSVEALIELPLHRNYRESRYLFSSTVHWKPIANGYSGYVAPSYVRLARRIRFLPNPRGFDLLRELGITHIVVHIHGANREEALESWERRFTTGPHPQIEGVYREEGISIYRVLRAR